MEKRIGGDYNCRICGGYHNSCIAAHYGMEPCSPMQEAQMAVEEAEKIIGEVSFIQINRQKINEFFSKLRQNFSIPKDPIYIQKDYSNEKLKRGLPKRTKMKFNCEELIFKPVMNATMLKRIQKAQKSRKKERSLQLTEKQILEGRKIFQNIKRFVKIDACMTEGQEKNVEEIFSKLEVALKISV